MGSFLVFLVFLITKGKETMLHILLLWAFSGLYIVMGSYCLFWPEKVRSRVKDMQKKLLRLWGFLMLFAGVVIILLLRNQIALFKLFMNLLEP